MDDYGLDHAVCVAVFDNDASHKNRIRMDRVDPAGHLCIRSDDPRAAVKRAQEVLKGASKTGDRSLARQLMFCVPQDRPDERSHVRPNGRLSVLTEIASLQP